MPPVPLPLGAQHEPPHSTLRFATPPPAVVTHRNTTPFPAMPEDGYGWEKLFSERMCRHFREDFGICARMARYHNVYGPHGTWNGGREKAQHHHPKKGGPPAQTRSEE